MPKYHVTITRIARLYVDVEAPDEETARTKAWERESELCNDYRLEDVYEIEGDPEIEDIGTRDP